MPPESLNLASNPIIAYVAPAMTSASNLTSKRRAPIRANSSLGWREQLHPSLAPLPPRMVSCSSQHALEMDQKSCGNNPWDALRASHQKISFATVNAPRDHSEPSVLRDTRMFSPAPHQR
eukprot:3854276-Amphidinium_carterae.1